MIYTIGCQVRNVYNGDLATVVNIDELGNLCLLYGWSNSLFWTSPVHVQPVD